MVLKYTNKTNFILLDGFARVCTVSANFPDNPRIYRRNFGEKHKRANQFRTKQDLLD